MNKYQILNDFLENQKSDSLDLLKIILKDFKWFW